MLRKNVLLVGNTTYQIGEEVDRGGLFIGGVRQVSKEELEVFPKLNLKPGMLLHLSNHPKVIENTGGAIYLNWVERIDEDRQDLLSLIGKVNEVPRKGELLNSVKPEIPKFSSLSTGTIKRWIMKESEVFYNLI